MNTENYTKNCLKTWSNIGDNIEHCAYGLVTESGEIMDMLKKHKFYGRDFNMVNLKEDFIKRAWFEACINANEVLGIITRGSYKIGYDIADAGSDKSANVVVHGNEVIEIIEGKNDKKR